LPVSQALKIHCKVILNHLEVQAAASAGTCVIAGLKQPENAVGHSMIGFDSFRGSFSQKMEVFINRNHAAGGKLLSGRRK